MLCGLPLLQILGGTGVGYAQSISPGGDRSATGLRMTQVTTNYNMQQNLLLTVLADAKKHLDRQAVIQLHDLKRDVTTWQTTTAESQAIFYDLDFGDYDVEVSAVGYKTEHRTVHVTHALQAITLDIVLQKDPTAVELSATDELIPPKQRKEAQKAVRDLKSGKLKDAQKRLEKLYATASSSAQVNFLFGYLYFQQNNWDKAESYLTQAEKLDPRRVQTLTLLGQVQMRREHYEDARKTLEKAVAANTAPWVAHRYLGEVYLKLHIYDKSREQAQLAINEGKNAASSAQLILGQALANVGRDKEGIEALKIFVQANPKDPIVPKVQDLIAQIEKRDVGEVATTRRQLNVDLVAANEEPSLPQSAWGPSGVDEIKPLVASDVACPLSQVLEKAGKGVKQLVDNVGQFAATEDLLHEQLDQYGNPITKETRKFDYVADISESPQGYFAFDENRNVRYGLLDLPDHIVTRGFVSLALIFHPDIQGDYEMTCEGLGQWKGQATWLIYFKQREGKPSRLENYKAGNETYPVRMKGRAWITADNFEIVRIESELMDRMPQLAVQHQIAEYGPVHFQKKNVDLWLPQSVDLYLELNKHRYYRRHSFDHYMLFSVAAEDKQDLSKIQKSGSSSGGCSSGAAAKN